MSKKTMPLTGEQILRNMGRSACADIARVMIKYGECGKLERTGAVQYALDQLKAEGYPIYMVIRLLKDSINDIALDEFAGAPERQKPVRW